MSEPEHVKSILQRVFRQLKENQEAVPETNILECPFCKCQEVHMQAVEVNRKGEITCIDSHGTKVQAGNPSGRGARVELTFFCEGGHKWTHSLQFHKGAVLLENKILIDGCLTCMEAFTSDLWRD
ncbi:MAG: hypothetical protein KKH04_19165 [Proteobacteria bacterium]|nr:hypothetical protein [Pseudomonadota bacterium]